VHGEQRKNGNFVQKEGERLAQKRGNNSLKIEIRLPHRLFGRGDLLLRNKRERTPSLIKMGKKLNANKKKGIEKTGI